MTPTKIIDFCGKDIDIGKLTPEAEKLLDEVLELLDLIEPFDPVDNTHGFWISVNRGSFEEWKERKDIKEEYGKRSLRWLKKEFNEYYPDEVNWFKLSSGYNERYHFKYLCVGEYAISLCKTECVNTNRVYYPYDATEFLAWVKEQVKLTIQELREGTFNQRIKDNLPYYHRCGTISRKLYWEHVPTAKANNLKTLTQAEIDHFIELASREHNDYKPDGRIKNMTFRQYFEYAFIAYKAAGYELPCDDVVKLFFRYGEDFGSGVLETLDYDSPKDFDDYYNDRCGAQGGHPWGIRRGSSRTRLSVYPRYDNDGYYFTFGGDPYFCIFEIVKMFNALHDSGVPIMVGMPQQEIAYLKEEDLIGIVPHSRMPIYCHGMFRGGNVYDFYHYYYDEHPELMELIDWQPIREIKLK